MANIIGIDIRGLTYGEQTGVGQYANGLLDAIVSHDSTNRYVLFDNQFRQTKKHALEGYEMVDTIKTRYPNKFLSIATVLTGRPTIGMCVKQKHRTLDYFFSPNINVTSISSKTKHILTIHDLSFEHYPEHFSWKRRMWHKVARPMAQCKDAYKIVTPSEYTKQDLVKTYNISEQKVHVISPGVTAMRGVCQEVVAQTKEKYALPESFMLFLGTVEPRKNILSIIEAFALLNRTDVPLIIAGATGWKNRDILAAIAASQGVRYIGYVPEEEKRALYKLATLFVYPSMYEGFGFPVSEAMAAGTPVITSHHSSLPEVAGDAAYLVNPRNVTELAHAMNLLLHDTELAQQYRQKGLKHVQQFQWQKAAEQWLSLL